MKDLRTKWAKGDLLKLRKGAQTEIFYFSQPSITFSTTIFNMGSAEDSSDKLFLIYELKIKKKVGRCYFALKTITLCVVYMQHSL